MAAYGDKKKILYLKAGLRRCSGLFFVFIFISCASTESAAPEIKVPPVEPVENPPAEGSAAGDKEPDPDVLLQVAAAREMAEASRYEAEQVLAMKYDKQTFQQQADNLTALLQRDSDPANMEEANSVIEEYNEIAAIFTELAAAGRNELADLTRLRQNAETARQNAIDLKAPVAASDLYGSGEDGLTKADSDKDNPEIAFSVSADGYRMAEETFNNSADRAEQLRVEAEQIIQATKESLDQLENIDQTTGTDNVDDAAAYADGFPGQVSAGGTDHTADTMPAGDREE